VPAGAGSGEAVVAATPAAPVKPGHHRQALRDERLLPAQAASAHTVSARRPRKRYFPADEARRLFSPTLRTRDRNLRSLTTDEAQLARYGLPIWRTEMEVATALELELSALRLFSTHSWKDRCAHYVIFAIPKRSGGERLIMAPKTRLKRLQRQLNALLVSKLPVSEYAHGFRRRLSVRTNAQPHVGKQVILRLDIKDFFGSIHFGRVRGLLTALGYGYPVATTLAAVMTEAVRQPVVVGDARFFPPVGPRVCPQGAPTSPGLSNAVVVKLDRRLAGLARRYGFSYTRYADDLTFSGNDIAAAHALRLLAPRVVEEEGFIVNERKTQVRRNGSRQTVTGVVVNDVLGLSRQDRRRLRAAIHQYFRAHADGDPDRGKLARLDGKVAYLSMLNAVQARRLASR
jgi:RNA-directed DNA polymerase